MLITAIRAGYEKPAAQAADEAPEILQKVKQKPKSYMEVQDSDAGL